MFLSNQNFPKIEHLDDILPKVSNLPEIRHVIHPNGYHTLCYMLSDKNTFSGEFANYAKECRGITFYPDGKIANRHLHKFFNVNEREDTQKHLLDWNKINNVSDKRDGSAIFPILVNNKIILKSKKSFTSDVANLANDFIKEKHFYHNFCEEMLRNNLSPIFEFTSNQARIVVNYTHPKLTLLHIRNTITGEYMKPDFLQNFGKIYNIPIVDYYPYYGSNEYFFDSLEFEKDFEGYIFQFNNGEMVKAKTKWYVELHKNCVFLNERNVAEMVLSETLDDYKSYLRESNAIETLNTVEQIEKTICDHLTKLEDEIECIVNENKHLQRKDFAIKHNKHEVFGLLMQCFIGQEVDYKEWYRKNKLKELFTIKQV